MRPPAGSRRPPPCGTVGRARRDATARPRSGRALNPALALGFRPLAPVEAVEAVALLWPYRRSAAGARMDGSGPVEAPCVARTVEA